MINEYIEVLKDQFPKIKKDDNGLVKLIGKLEKYDDRDSMILLGRAYESLINLRKGQNSVVNCNCGTLIEVPQSTKPKQWGCPDCSAEFYFPARNFSELLPRFIVTELTIPDSDAILCLDFGTSTIKAAIKRDSDGLAEPLNLGMHAITDGLYNEDQSSIPSAIFISKTDNCIYFGQDAILRGQRGDQSILFEISPKRWLIELNRQKLNEPLIAGVSRKNLLSGLLSVALEAAMDQGSFDTLILRALELRVSHPVWRTEDAERLNKSLKEITEVAVNLVHIRKSNTLEPIKNAEEFFQRVYLNQATYNSSKIDVEEPVAAAIELFENQNNSREICVIIDVGAGTTDIGLFQSLTPDNVKDVKRKIIPLKPPVSIYQAGDFIDQELINTINAATSVALTPSQIAEINGRRRQIKETLFKSGQIVEFGIQIKLSDLIKRDGIKEFCDGIKQEFINQIESAEDIIHSLFSAKTNSIQKIDVIFAGGGANIKFLNEVIQNTEIKIKNYTVPIVIRRPNSDKYNNLKAPIERLAVALGGTLDGSLWPETKMKGSANADALGYKTPTYIQY